MRTVIVAVFAAFLSLASLGSGPAKAAAAGALATASPGAERSLVVTVRRGGGRARGGRGDGPARRPEGAERREGQEGEARTAPALQEGSLGTMYALEQPDRGVLGHRPQLDVLELDELRPRAIGAQEPDHPRHGGGGQRL